MYAMAAPPGPSGAPGTGGAAGGGAAGGGAIGSPPMGRYGVLRIVSGNDQGKQIELNRTVTTIGRGADQMLVIADIAVSRRHLQILLQPNGYSVKDLGSPNGTMVNGKRVAEGQLFDGDQIEVGNSLLRFEHPPSRQQQDAPPPPPPQPMMQPPPPQPMMQPPPPQPMMMPQQPYGVPAQPMGFQPQQPGFGAPQLAMPQAAFPSVVQPLPGSAAPMQSAAQVPMEPSMYGASMVIPQSPPGPLGFLAVPKKRTLYFGVLGGALAIGLIGLIVTSATRSGGGKKEIEKAIELYTNGTKNFTASRYDEARKAFEQAQALAPDSDTIKQYIEACNSEEKVAKIVEAAKGALEKREYAKALKEYDRVPKDSTQYEDAQRDARMAKREAVKGLITEANTLAKNDPQAALNKVNDGLSLEADNADLQDLKNRLSNAPAKPATPEETTPPVVAENTPPPKPDKPEPKKPDKPEPKKPDKPEPKKPDKVAEPAGGSGDLGSNKAALAAYQKKDFAGAIGTMKGVKAPKAAQTVKDLEEVKANVDKAAKLEGSNASGAAAAYQAAAAADKRLGGGLASFLSGKISGLQKGGSATASKAPAAGSAPASGGDAAKDAQADQLLAQAKSLIAKNPTQAKVNCRKVMQLYGNSPKNPKVQEAFRLYNSIKTRDDDDDF